MVNLTIHPGDIGILLPQEIRHEEFSAVVNEGITADSPKERWPSEWRYTKSQVFKWPEHEFANKVLSIEPEKLDEKLKTLLEPQGLEMFRALYNMHATVSGKKDAGKKAVGFYRTLGVSGWLGEIGTHKEKAENRASFAAGAFLAAGAGMVALAASPLLRRTKWKQLDRRALLKRSLLALALSSAAGGVYTVRPQRPAPITWKQKAGENDAEFLKAKIEDVLFPTLKITGRSALIADSAVETAKEIMHSGKSAGGIKILINAGGRHADIVNFLKNDAMRKKKLAWYQNEIRARIGSALKDAIREEYDGVRRALEKNKATEKARGARKESEKPKKLGRRDFFRTLFGKRAETRRRT